MSPADPTPSDPSAELLAADATDASTRQSPRWRVAVAIGLALATGAVAVSTTVASLAQYCSTTHTGDQRALSAVRQAATASHLRTRTGATGDLQAPRTRPQVCLRPVGGWVEPVGDDETPTAGKLDRKFQAAPIASAVDGRYRVAVFALS